MPRGKTKNNQKGKTSSSPYPDDTPVTRRQVNVRFTKSPEDNAMLGNTYRPNNDSPQAITHSAQNTQQNATSTALADNDCQEFLTPGSSEVQAPVTSLSPDVLQAINLAVRQQLHQPDNQKLLDNESGHINLNPPSQPDVPHVRKVPTGDSQEVLGCVQHTSPPNLTDPGLADRSIADVLQALLSPQDQNTGQTSGMLLSSEELPLDVLIPEKIKEKIRGGSYIDLASLLFPNTSPQSIQINQNNLGGHSLQFQPTSSRKINHSEQWLRAMFIYGSIYLPSKPGEIAQFFKYLEFIIGLRE